jgi:glycosyltransferase involved in cell wall biosynthesis
MRKSLTNERKDKCIGVVTFPVTEAGLVPVENLVKIFCSISKDVYLISGNQIPMKLKHDKEVHIACITHNPGRGVVSRILKYGRTQFSIAFRLFMIRSKVRTWAFFIGSDTLFVPMLVSKALGKTALLILSGSSTKTLESMSDNLAGITRIIARVNCLLADRIIAYSPCLAEEWNLGRYADKVRIANHHFLDFEAFGIQKSWKHRDKFVGFVGRLSEEKGILQFAEAMPIAIRQDPKLRFVIAGDGQLKDEIHQYIDKFDPGKRARMTGWVPHDELPNLLNKLKLVVIPSFTEGLPSVMLEAMACGTPVLASPVGAIPDVIKEGETGFILPDNSPESISERIIDVISSPYLSTVSERALELVHERFSYEKVVRDWSDVLENVSRNC